MPAYAIAEVKVTDPAVFAEYAKLVPDTIAMYGGRYLARGGTVECKEGDRPPSRVVVLEFPTLEQARKWYHSPEYTRALAIRQRAAETRLIFVEGIA